mmetsp:Transcript_53178/g.134347  ORF Transcript_53178/g.134347 Transcript_53178/m.134347 type:complete len:239 (+) Transcript_53178:1230-1946(+)
MGGGWAIAAGGVLPEQLRVLRSKTSACGCACFAARQSRVGNSIAENAGAVDILDGTFSSGLTHLWRSSKSALLLSASSRRATEDEREESESLSLSGRWNQSVPRLGVAISDVDAGGSIELAPCKDFDEDWDAIMTSSASLPGEAAEIPNDIMHGVVLSAELKAVLMGMSVPDSMLFSAGGVHGAAASPPADRSVAWPRRVVSLVSDSSMHIEPTLAEPASTSADTSTSGLSLLCASTV